MGSFKSLIVMLTSIKFQFFIACSIGGALLFSLCRSPYWKTRLGLPRKTKTENDSCIGIIDAGRCYLRVWIDCSSGSRLTVYKRAFQEQVRNVTQICMNTLEPGLRYVAFCLLWWVHMCQTWKEWMPISTSWLKECVLAFKNMVSAKQKFRYSCMLQEVSESYRKRINANSLHQSEILIFLSEFRPRQFYLVNLFAFFSFRRTGSIVWSFRSGCTA